MAMSGRDQCVDIATTAPSHCNGSLAVKSLCGDTVTKPELSPTTVKSPAARYALAVSVPIRRLVNRLTTKLNLDNDTAE
jgi:hypothetical protein